MVCLVSNLLLHFIIYRVNRRAANDAKIPHHLYWGGWKRLRERYDSIYPESRLYSMTLALSIACLAIALVAACVLWWQFASGRLR